MKKFLSIFLLATFALVTGVACNKTDTNNQVGQTIKLGWISGLSGGTATFGQPALNAAQMAIDEINQGGGIGGKKIELIVEDSQCNASASTTAAEKLINIDDVSIIFTNCSTETLSVAALTEPKHIITFGALSTSPAISESGDYVFRVSPKETQGTRLMVDYALNRGYEKVATLIANNDFTIAVKQDFEKFFVEQGGHIVSSSNFDSDQSDFRSELAKIKNSPVEVILFAPLKSVDSLNFLKQARELGITLPILSTRSFINQDSLDKAGGLMDGIIFAEIKFDQDNQAVRDFLQKYIDIYGGEPTYSLQMIAGSYDRAIITAGAIKKCEGDKDTNCIRDYLYRLNNYQGLSGIISMDKNGDPDMEFELLTVKAGEIVEL